MSSFVLKLVALISMLFDHTSYYLFRNNFSAFNLIGRLAFPIFSFQLTEGFIHTKSKKKYAIRLLVFAIISQIPFMLFRTKYINSDFSLNIFFTLLLGLICIWIYNKNKIYGIISLFAISAISELIKCDYGMYGILIIFIFYIFKEKRFLMNISFIIVTIIKYLSHIIIIPLKMNYIYAYISLCIFTIISIIFINFYNKKEGPKMKYLFYIFYPLHLLLLYFL